jgi:uncharacterized membrane protein YadS
VMLIALAVRGGAPAGAARPRLLPTFLFMFILLLLVNSAGLVPAAASEVLSVVSRWCLVVAIAALGIKTSLQQFAALGWRPIALMVGETLLLAVLVVGALALG